MVTKKEKLKKELEAFEKVWHGGYYTGYSDKRNQKGVEEFLKNNLKGEVLLEIGCGGGQWTKFIFKLGIFKKIICIDALSAEHNKFWENLGEEAKSTIEYHHVKNFKLADIEDESLDFVFSYDVFCHISLSGTEEYIKSLYSKCNNDCQLMIMYADPSKYLNSEPENREHVIKYLPNTKLTYRFSNRRLIEDALEDSDGLQSNLEPRWYWVGIEAFRKLIHQNSFNIINIDLDIDNTNPITSFQKI